MKLSKFLFLAALSSQACTKSSEAAKEASCPLSPGNYGVQTALYQADKGEYELMVLNAPSCFRQPLKLKNLQLAQFEDSEKDQKVQLTYAGEENSVLHMAQDFQIKMVQTVTENGVKKEQSGSWSPFLTGLAGGVAGAVAGNMLSRAFNKPQHYTPPPMEAGKTEVRGYGGVGDSRSGAVRSYQQNYATRPSAPTPAPVVAPAADTNKKSFFKTKSDTVSPREGAVRTYQPAPSSAPKRGFFKSKRR